MRSPFLLLALLILCAPVRAEPGAKLHQDRARDSAAEVAPGQWFDLLLLVEPREPVAEDGLEAVPVPLKGAEFGATILPAADATGAFKKPFTIRVPVKLAEEKRYELAVLLKGKTAAGAAFEVRATGKVRPLAELKRAVDATVALKGPARAGEANAIVVNATVIDGFHVYGTEVEVGTPMVGMLLPAPGARGAAAWTGGGSASPKGTEIEGTFSFEIPFTPAREGRIEARVLLDWMPCDADLCYANELAYLPLSFESAAGSGPASGAASTPGAVEEAASASSSSDGLDRKGLLELLLLSVGAGIFALLMPCTYPLIPITISFFSKQAEARRGSSVPLALAYGAGIVAIFTLIGLVVGAGFAAAESVANLATVWWLNLLFALLFLVFGLSLLGLYEIRLPSAFDDIAAKASGTGGYLSVFAMGLTLVITSFTCTAPFIGSLLVFAAKGGQLGTAVLCMAVFGLTMAVPFVFLSLSPKGFQALPKSGEWMKRLKVTLGIVELGLVLKFASNVDIARGWFLVDRQLFLVLWAASFLAAALYLFGVFDLLVGGPRAPLGRGRAVAALLMLGATGALVYGATGPRLGKYLEAFLPSFEAEYNRAFVAVADDYDAGVRLAQENGANIFLHFTGYT